MGLVKISDGMHENLRIASNALNRSINAQAEHWMRVGMLAELHPELNHSEICRLLVRSELAGGLEIGALAVASEPSAQAALRGVQ
ncbi:ParD-like family protein [Niveibacterium terrae]|uniref:ParD-like family protein n=1 Tax=Niveibacterium terrae TaxID=3373598 RepID=UPI003A924B9E